MFKFLKYFLVISLSLIFVTLGIDAVDHYDSMQSSIVGKFLKVEDNPCDDDMVFVPNDRGGFCIDKYEASAGEKCLYNNPENQDKTRVNLNSIDCGAVSSANTIPWRFISVAQAKVACSRSGKRLPNSEEWYQASLGTIDIDNNWSEDDCQVSSNWPEQPGKTGFAKNCISSFGAYDMIGNVWEWVDGEIVDGKYDGKELPENGFVLAVDNNGLALKTGDDGELNYNQDYFWIKKSGIRTMARGGYWDNKEKAGFYAMYLVSEPDFVGTGIGFRCVK